MQKVRWGVLSTADIATRQVIPAMQQGTYCEIAAIASRSLEKARAVAAQLGIPKAYGSYEELLADPEIIEIPFNAPANQPCKIWYQHGDETEEIQVEACNQYTLQGDAFSQAVLNNTGVPTPIEDAVANMKVIEAVFKSAKTGTWV